jgi:hypothetical protein
MIIVKIFTFLMMYNPPSWNDHSLSGEWSRQIHDKNLWEWSHVLGEGMDFQTKEWSFLFRNGLIAHIGCKAGAMALSFIQCSHSHKVLLFLSYYIRDINKLFIDVLRGIQGLSKAEKKFAGQFTCLNNFDINILI